MTIIVNVKEDVTVTKFVLLQHYTDAMGLNPIRAHFFLRSGGGGRGGGVGEEVG